MKTAAAAALILTLAGCAKGTVDLDNKTPGHMEFKAENVSDGMNGANFTMPEGTSVLHIDYKVEKGTLDIKIGSLEKIDEAGADATAEDFEEVMDETNVVDEAPGLQGEGELEFELKPGEYMITFYEHKLTGEAVLEAK